jgi:hypothetical protein
MRYTVLMLILHIIIAIISLALAGTLLMRPSPMLSRLNNLMILSTTTSGMMLVLQGAAVLHVCVSGVFYSLIVIALTQFARRRTVRSFNI